MKRLLFIILFIIFSSTQLYSATQSYFVTPTGNASDPDCSGGGAPSCSGAWDVSDFNSSSNWSTSENANKIDPDDVVYFTGSFTDNIRLPDGYYGTSGTHIVLDGYYAGDCDPVADMERPYGFHDGSNDASVLQDSYATWTDNVIGMYIKNVTDGSGCTITARTATTLTCTLGGGSENKWDAGDLYALSVGGNDPSACPNAATIDVTRYNASSGHAITITDTDYMTIQDFNLKGSYTGIYVRPSTSSNNTGLTIRRNYIHDMEGNCMSLLTDDSYNYWEEDLVIGGADGDGNYLYDCNEGARSETTWARSIHITATDFIISYNFIANNPRYQNTGNNCEIILVSRRRNGLIERNVLGYPHGQSALMFDDKSTNRFIVRFNRIDGSNGTGAISLRTLNATIDDVWLYGNYILNSKGGGFEISRYFDDIYIWANVINNLDPEYGSSNSRGIDIYKYPSDSIGRDVWATNNTIARVYRYASGTYGGGIYFGSSSPADGRFANNILYYNSTSTDRQFIVNSGNESYVTAIKNNTIWSNSTPYFYYNGASRTVSYINSLSKGSDNKAEDPLFNSPAGPDGDYGDYDDDYSLSGDSPSVEDGTSEYAECWYPEIMGAIYTVCRQYLLNPADTDFGKIPPDAETSDVSGLSAWPRGAYAPAGPETNLLAPLGRQACTTDPETITISVSTPDNNANCKYSDASVEGCETSFDNLNTNFTNGQGTTSHTTNISQDCDGVKSYVIKCQDTTSGFVSQCVTAVVDIAEYGGALPPLNIWYDSGAPLEMPLNGTVNIESGIE